MQVWTDTLTLVARTGLTTLADATHFMATHGEFRRLHVDLEFGGTVDLDIVSALVGGDVTLVIYSEALVPAFVEAAWAIQAACAITTDVGVFGRMTDIGVWTAAVWREVAKHDTHAIVALTDGLLRKQAPRDGWRALGVMHEPYLVVPPLLCFLAKQAEMKSVAIHWASLAADWAADSLALVETRIYMPKGLPDLIVQRARGASIASLTHYAQTHLSYATGLECVSDYVLHAPDDKLWDVTRTLEAHGIHDDTPLALAQIA